MKSFMHKYNQQPSYQKPETEREINRDYSQNSLSASSQLSKHIKEQNNAIDRQKSEKSTRKRQKSKKKKLNNELQKEISFSRTKELMKINELLNFYKQQEQRQSLKKYSKKSMTLQKNLMPVSEIYKKELQNTNFQKGIQIINNLYLQSLSRKQRVENQAKVFIKTLKNHTSLRNTSSLLKNDYKYIDDRCYFYKKQKKNSSLINFTKRKCLPFQKYFLNKIPIFMPSNLFKLTWDIFSFMFTFVFLFFYSILMFFDYSQTTNYFITQIIFQVAFTLFTLDILINFNTGFFLKDQVITERKLIADKYIKSYFVPDFTSITLLSLNVIFNESNILSNPDNSFLLHARNSLIYFKGFSMLHKRRNFENLIAFKDNNKHLIRLLENIILVVLVAHLLAISWHGLAIIEYKNNFSISWMQKVQILETPIINMSWEIRYIYSFYWSVTTMCTVGYGDISPTNQYEALFATINMILISCVFAYSINNIGMILQEIEKNSKQLKDNQSTIQNYLERKNVNNGLKSRVRHYLNFLAEEQKDRNKVAEDEILQKLSNGLRDEITMEINCKIINSYQIFARNFSVQTINKLVFAMKEVLTLPNEVIFKENDADDMALYFIYDGKIEIFYQNQTKNDIVIKTLSSNTLFGEISFFSGLSRKASARSVNLSTLYKIQRQDFLDILALNSEDFQRQKMIQEQIIFQKDYSFINIECYNCGKQNHLAQYCPNVHSLFDNQFVVLRNNFSLFQPRRSQDRKQIKQCAMVLATQNKIIQQKLKYNLTQEDKYYTFFDQDTNFSSAESSLNSSQSSASGSGSGSSSNNSSGSETPSSPSSIRRESIQKPQENFQKEFSLNLKGEEILEKSIFSQKSYGTQKSQGTTKTNSRLNLSQQYQSLQKNQYLFLQNADQQNQQSIADAQKTNEDSQNLDVLYVKQKSKKKKPSLSSQLSIQNKLRSTNSITSIQLKSTEDILDKDSLVNKQNNMNISNSARIINNQISDYINTAAQQINQLQKQQNDLLNVITKLHKIDQKEMERNILLAEQSTNIKKRDSVSIKERNKKDSLSTQSDQQNQQMQMSQIQQNIQLFFQNSLGLSINEAKINNNVGMGCELDHFDQIKIFQKFFPHNNFDKVIMKLKERTFSKRKTTKQQNQIKRRTNLLGISSEQLSKNIVTLQKRQNVCELKTNENCIMLLQPTFLSYGIALKNISLYPKRYGDDD